MTAIRTHHPHHKPPTWRMDGIAYLGLLIFIAIIGVAAAATLQLGSIVQRRDAEEELLAIGSEFRLALISYAAATPAGQSSTPPTLQDLLKDARYPNTRRHLRKLYVDPMTGKDDWGVVKSIDGKGIIGVHSLATSTPIKIGNFTPEFQHFTGKMSYAEWVFIGVTAGVTEGAPSKTTRPIQ